MSDLPLPLPDRRTLGNSTNPNIKILSTNKFSKDNSKINDNQINSNNLSDSIEESSKTLVKRKQIDDMRQKILNYNLLTEKSIFFSSPSGSSKINRCNAILFGPSGSGKSSFKNHYLEHYIIVQFYLQMLPIN